jgi:hypothetical protein
MQLGLIGYYSDFVVYPVAIVVLRAAGRAGPGRLVYWAGFSLPRACLGLWTLIEYLLHRFGLHPFPTWGICMIVTMPRNARRWGRRLIQPWGALGDRVFRCCWRQISQQPVR